MTSISNMAAVLFLLAFVGFTATSPCAAVPVDANGNEPPSASAVAFLRARCSTVEQSYSEYCYKELLPYAGSFEGNKVKVAEVAAGFLARKLVAVVEEMRKAKGPEDDGNLDGCIKLYTPIINPKETDLALKSLGRLSIAGDGKRSKQDLDNARKWISDAQISHTQCEMLLNNIFTYDGKLPARNDLQDVLYVAIPLIEGLTL